MYSIYKLHKGLWKWVWTFSKPTQFEMASISAYSRHPEYIVVAGGVS